MCSHLCVTGYQDILAEKAESKSTSSPAYKYMYDVTCTDVMDYCECDQQHFAHDTHFVIIVIIVIAFSDDVSHR